jgi:hypothetical protein
VGCDSVKDFRSYSSISNMLTDGRLAITRSMLLVHFTVTLKIKSVFLIFDLGSVMVTKTAY